VAGRYTVSREVEDMSRLVLRETCRAVISNAGAVVRFVRESGAHQQIHST
jgi:hypothetical protein